VAEHVLALIFSLARGVTEHHCRTMAGEWVASNVFSPNMGAIFSVKNMQLGIVGAGTLGRATAELAESVGMRIVYAYRNSNANQREKKDGLQRLLLPELLAESDVVSLHCPLTPQTHGLIGAKELALMKPTALLINTARGALVESQALVDALNSGQLGGAGIDVLSQEPPSNEPLLSCHHPRLLITPHVGWASTEALRTFHQQLAENLECFHAGKPQHVVT
jgi:glycerate dehydrogenase